MKKRAFAALLAVVMAVTLLPVTATAADSDFVIASGVLTKYNGPGGDVVIPTGVTAIGNFAFQYCGSVTSVTIPAGVTTIGIRAFERCGNLTSVEIPEGVTSIGVGAFDTCVHLTSVTIPDSVTEIGNSAFGECHDLSSVTIGKGVTTIGGTAFYYCNSLTKLVIPDNVTSIGDSAFYNCHNLASVTIPASVTSMGSSVFKYCDDLMIHGDRGSEAEQYAAKNGFPFIVDADFTIENGVLTQYNGPGGDVTVPNDVTGVGDRAFAGCTGLTSVTILENVTSLGADVFAGCDDLTLYCSGNSAAGRYAAQNGIPFVDTDFTIDKKGVLTRYTGPGGHVVIPDGVSAIGDCVFYGRTYLTGVVIPDSVTTIGWDAFRECSDLSSVTMGKGVTTIGWSAFNNCTSLTNVDIPAGATGIGGYAFAHCGSLTGVTIPGSMTSIGEYAFAGCDSLTSIVVPSSVTSIGEYAFAYCENLTIRCDADSVAEQHCVENNIPYMVGEAPGTACQGDMTAEDGTSLSWSMTAEGEVAVTERLAPGEAVLVACYDNAGKFTGVKWIDANSPEAQIDPATPNVKLFWLSGAQAPLSPSVTVWGK